MSKLKRNKPIIVGAMLLMAVLLLSGCSESAMVLDPRGPIAAAQKDLIYIATALCAIVIVPVLVMTGVIVWRYRDTKNRQAKYSPEWEHNTKLEVTWWGVPILVIVALAIVTVIYTYKLEPSKPLKSEVKPLEIQVVSLDWKWLFIYPEQNIATVNYVKFPEDRPIKFRLTSDAPMNSFWIPQLGGQVYTMSGMAMTLHLQADEPGVYFGSGANFSGEHFGDMSFDATALTTGQFDEWVKQIQSGTGSLSDDVYNELSKPSVIQGEQQYSSVANQLFERTVRKYATNHHSTNENE